MSLAVANQYAKALLETVEQPSSGAQPEDVLRQLDLFAETLKSSHELHTVLLSPAVNHAGKQRVLGRISDILGLHVYLKNFLFVVTRHRRLDILPEIRERFQSLLDESHGLLRARVSTAQALSAEQQLALESALARVTGKQVRCGFEVDGALVGGVSVRVGSTMYDGSVRGHIESLRRRLSE